MFDYPRQRSYLVPGRRFADPFEWDMAGVVTEITSEGALQVIDVIVGSPAIESDIRPGDAIVAIDGRPVAELMDKEVWNAFARDGARLKLAIDRHGERLTKTIVLLRMI